MLILPGREGSSEGENHPASAISSPSGESSPESNCAKKPDH